MIEVSEDNALEMLRDLLGKRGRGGQDCLWNIPNHMHGALARYIVFGISGGKFLTAVMENNLVEACLRADDVNQRHLREWALLVYNDLPMACSGSPEKVKKWIEGGGTSGKERNK